MGYVVHFNAYPSVVGAETYRKVTIPYDKDFLPVCKAERPTTPSVVGETVDVRRHVACCRAISDILHDLLVQRLTPYSIVNRRTALACFGCRERLNFQYGVFFGYLQLHRHYRRVRWAETLLMSKACAPGAPRHEVALPRCAALFPVASLSAAEPAAKGMWWRPSPLPPGLPAPSLLPWVPTELPVLPLGTPELLLLPAPPRLLQPRPRPCLPPLLRSRPRRAPLRLPLSLETNACSGCREDRCAPFFRGRLK